ncbi:MAG: DUF2889 domain-containing protein, partial [Alphaproteobacteria bacterium]
REHLHTRRIETRGYRREDGLWDIEGTLVDTKTYAFWSHAHGDMPVGKPVHDMTIRLTINDELVIHEAVGCMDHTPYPICGNAALNVEDLKGLKIGPGWTRRAHKLMGGRRGCTHLFELLRPIATTCFQTMSGSRFREDKEHNTELANDGKRPFFIDSCHALAADGDIVKDFWPQFYEDRSKAS